MTRLNLLVIRAADPRNLVRFYSTLGLEFVEEKHGSGPTHFACELGGSVFEIYPLGKKNQPTTSACLGFGVRSLDDTLAKMNALGETEILQPPQRTASGLTALVVDPEGHRVDLRESASVEVG